MSALGTIETTDILTRSSFIVTRLLHLRWEATPSMTCSRKQLPAPMGPIHLRNWLTLLISGVAQTVSCSASRKIRSVSSISEAFETSPGCLRTPISSWSIPVAVTGKVVDPDGNPVPDARVEISYFSQPVDGVGQQSPFYDRLINPESTIDKQGWFELPRMPSGLWLL